MEYTKTIYDIFAEFATTIGCKYDYGSFKELQKRLIEQSKDKTKQVNKYPLLCLVTPITETRGNNAKYMAEVSVNLLLLAETSKDYTTAQRVALIYTPTLYPLFDDLMDEIKNMKYFDTSEFGELEYEYADLFHYSTSEAKDQNKFAAVLDGIEITNLKLKVLTQNCL